MSDRADVVVVGAGIVGAACACWLARAGASVMVLDRSEPAGGTTGAGMGHLVVMDAHPAQLELTLLSRRLWDERAPTLSAAVEYRRRGTLWIATDDEQWSMARAKHAAFEAAGVASVLMSGAGLAEAEPALVDGLAGALCVPGDAVIDPPAATRQLLGEAIEAGARRRTGVVREVGEGWVELEGGRTLRAEHVVVAAGLATPSVLATRAFDDAIVPRKGHLAITEPAPQRCRHQLVELGYFGHAHGHAAESTAFNLQPKANGSIVIGSSRQYGVDHDRVEPAVLDRMLQHAFGFMPSLARLSRPRAWGGLRPATADGLPLIGPVPGDPRTLLAAGHEGLGITTSLGTAAIIAALVQGHEPPIEASPFAPARIEAHSNRRGTPS